MQRIDGGVWLAVVTSEGNNPKKKKMSKHIFRMPGWDVATWPLSVRTRWWKPVMVHQGSAAESLFIRGEVAGSRQVWEPNSGALGMNNGPNLDAVSTSSEIPADWFALRCHICCLVIRFHLWNRYCSSFFVFVVCFFFLKISGILSKSQHVGRSVCKFNPAPHVWLSHEGTVAFFLRHRGQKKGAALFICLT